MKKKELITALLVLCMVASMYGCKKKTEKKAEFKSSTYEYSLKGNVTTGYTWVESFDKEGIVSSENEYVQDEQGEGSTGSAGKFVFKFTSIACGKVTVTFKYIQPWDTEAEPAETETITLIVAEDGSISLK